MNAAAMKLDQDDFTLFGLPRRHTLDRAELDARWRALQAQVHPDRFAAEGAAAQRVAMQWVLRVNQAYQRLKDPLSRGAYLCELAGVAIDAERNTAMPADFLMQQMAWREALEEAESAAQIEALDERVAAEERSLLDALRADLDDALDPHTAAARVRALMFVRRFRSDIEARIEAIDA